MFKVGDSVRCVFAGDTPALNNNWVYVITDVAMGIMDDTELVFKLEGLPQSTWYSASRFKAARPRMPGQSPSGEINCTLERHPTLGWHHPA